MLWKGAIFGIFWILLTQLVGWQVGRRLPYSWHYEVDGDRRERNLTRLRDTALQALADLQGRKEGCLFAKPQATELCVGIVSRSSGTRQKLGVTVGSLLARIPSTLADQVRITVFNASDPPEGHLEAVALERMLAVRALQYPHHLPSPSEIFGRAPEVKEVLDYAVALRMLEGQQCRRYLVLEDGAVAGTAWAQRVLEIARRTAKRRIVMTRMMASLDEVRFTWREPQVFMGILAMAAGTTLVVWLGSAFILGLMSPAWQAAVLYCNPVILLLLLINFYIALLMVGRPNLLPARTVDRVREGDTQFLATANLYPNAASLTGYRSILEERLRTVRYPGEDGRVQTPDRYYARLVEKFSRETGQRYTMGLAVPSIFQNTGKGGMDVTEIPMSFDFGQDDCPIRVAPSRRGEQK